jgi:hypothetical protein
MYCWLSASTFGGREKGDLYLLASRTKRSIVWDMCQLLHSFHDSNSKTHRLQSDNFLWGSCRFSFETTTVIVEFGDRGQDRHHRSPGSLHDPSRPLVEETKPKSDSGLRWDNRNPNSKSSYIDLLSSSSSSRSHAKNRISSGMRNHSRRKLRSRNMRPSHRNKVLPSFPWTKVSHNMILQDWNKKE